MTTLEEIWPVFRLRIEAGPVELSAMCDDDIPLLGDLASRGIHEPDAMPTRDRGQGPRKLPQLPDT